MARVAAILLTLLLVSAAPAWAATGQLSPTPPVTLPDGAGTTTTPTPPAAGTTTTPTPPPAAAASGLPHTGLDVRLLLLVAVALLAAGAAVRTRAGPSRK
jgi:hypothetical protein